MSAHRAVYLVWRWPVAVEPIPAVRRAYSADLAPRGQWREAIVPDTLELAQRARFSINILTNGVEPKQYYSVYQCFSFGNGKATPSNLTWNITGKYARALPWMRVMSGSRQNLDVELAMMRALVGQINANGLMEYPYGGEGAPKGTSYPLVSAITALSLLNWYQRDRNPVWLDYARTLCDGRTSLSLRRGQNSPPVRGHRMVSAGAPGAIVLSMHPGEMTFDQQGSRVAKFSGQNSVCWLWVRIVWQPRLS